MNETLTDTNQLRIIKDDARVRLAQQVNLTSALRTALLLLPPQFSQQELYEKITSLSYSGDPRMTVGENPDKVANIVSAQMEQFHTLYEPLAMHLRGVRFVPGWRKVPQGQRLIRVSLRLHVGMTSAIVICYEIRVQG